MNATIYDVSRLSGVSTATVSRTFSDPDRVRDSTEILHYSPNAIARAMVRQRTDKIAFLICKKDATILDEFYARICESIMRRTMQSDRQLVISTASDWAQAAGTAQNKQVEGVILGGSAQADMVSEFQSKRVAVVLVNDENATVKRFYCTGTTITLMPQSTNPEHRPQVYDLAQTTIRVLGKVIKAETLIQ